MDINNLPKVNTVESLKNVMVALNTSDGPVTDDDLIWFVCIQRAEEVIDSTKAVARLFLNGITTCSDLNAVQSYLDECFEFEDEDEDEDEDDFTNRSLVANIARFLGNIELADEILES